MVETGSKTRWGVPLVLPHVLLSVGLLAFASLSERSAPSHGVAPAPVAAVPLAAILRRS